MLWTGTPPPATEKAYQRQYPGSPARAPEANARSAGQGKRKTGAHATCGGGTYTCPASKPAPPACCPCAGESVGHDIPRPSNGRRPPRQQLQDSDMISAEGGGPRRVSHIRPNATPSPTPLKSVANPSAAAATGGGGKKASTFQLGRNSTHHAMSARAAAGRLMRCAKAGNRRRKMRPGRTTLHAKGSTPIRDSSSRLVHYCRVRHAGRQSRSRASLSGGRRISRREESRVTPRNWRQRVGRTSFSDAKGDTEVAAEVLESLQVSGARSMGVPPQKIIIEVMEDAAAPANVYGNPGKRPRERSEEEGGRAGPTREPEGDA